jgi:hypothetical protein
MTCVLKVRITGEVLSKRYLLYVDYRPIPLQFKVWWPILLLTSRHIKGTPDVPLDDFWKTTSQRLVHQYIYCCRKSLVEMGIPIYIHNNRKGSYCLVVPDGVTVEIDPSVLTVDDNRVTRECA